MSSDFPRFLYPIQYEDAVRTALAEDLGRGGDITSDAVVAIDQGATARIISREVGRISGVDVALSAFRNIDRAIDFEVMAADGAVVTGSSTVVNLRGSARSILTAERTALNFLGRLSGIATLTGLFVSAVQGTGARIVCTRKTTPGLRVLEKYAVRCGGGWNHRFGLDDAVLIKDNHLAAAGGVAEAVDRVRRAVGHTVLVEVEVDTLDQLEQALAVGVDAVLLDNMSADELRESVAMVDGRVTTEASGGVTLENVTEIAQTGVDLISVGALTHSAPSLDLSLELEIAD